MKPRERQYHIITDKFQQQGLTTLGLMTSQAWDDDPKRLAFTFARYKFVAKMLEGRAHVIEVGCADAFASRIVLQHVGRLTVTDFDPVFVNDVKARMSAKWPYDCFVHDLLSGPPPGSYDAAYALDVLEHVRPENEKAFVSNISASLTSHGVLIIGMPSLECQTYASEVSRLGHVNCKTMPDLKTLMESYFHTVFCFSMNDEVVHTGFHKMANYLFAVGCGKR